MQGHGWAAAGEHRSLGVTKVMSFNDEHAIETYKSLISISTEALKAFQWLNGGAVVALLAYIGQRPE